MELAANHPADLHLCASVDGHECFPFYVYESDGVHENITDWALEHFREHYNDKKITKWDIFYDVYGILHHSEYRTKYAENLKRELPRIPLVDRVILRSEATKNPGIAQNPKTGILRSVQNDSAEEPQHDNDVFWAFANAGKELAGLHIDCEKLEPWPLKFIETLSGVLGANVAASLLARRQRKAASSKVAQVPPFGLAVFQRRSTFWKNARWQIESCAKRAKVL